MQPPIWSAWGLLLEGRLKTVVSGVVLKVIFGFLLTKLVGLMSQSPTNSVLKKEIYWCYGELLGLCQLVYWQLKEGLVLVFTMPIIWFLL